MHFPGWAEGQLAREIEDNCWFVLSSSKDIILQKARGHPPIHLSMTICPYSRGPRYVQCLDVEARARIKRFGDSFLKKRKEENLLLHL